MNSTILTYFTHEREGFWRELQPGKTAKLSPCASGTCPGSCLLAARGEKPSGAEPYCAWLLPVEGEGLGHFRMVEGGAEGGERGRVYNPYVVRGHTPRSNHDHPLARAFLPAKHALLSEFYRLGHKASSHYACRNIVENELGREAQVHTMRIYNQHPEWLQLFLELAVDFLWDFATCAALPARTEAEIAIPLLLSPNARARQLLARD
jgi:hypothetical protein